jgi:hypothetical protein
MDTRGEIAIKLGGSDYTLLPTYEAIRQIENQTGHSVMELMRSGEALTLDQISIIFCEGIKAFGKNTGDTMLGSYNYKAVGELIFADRQLVRSCRCAMLFLMHILSGGSTPKKADAELESQSQMSALGSAK